MKIADLTWQQVEAYLAGDDRVVLPLGSTEQHCGLSLSVDSILAERVALEAAEPIGVPVFPVLPYGVSPYFQAYPGSISIRVDTYVRFVRDILDCLYHQGFRRIVLVNGHGGNQPAASLAAEWMADREGATVKFHNWYSAPQTAAAASAIDPVGSHASWIENFSWTRVAGVEQPPHAKPMVDLARIAAMGPKALRAHVGDGNYGGPYQQPDADMQRLWEVAVAETRALVEGPWG